MNSKGVENKIFKAIDIFFTALTFLFAMYFMSCFLISFRKLPFKIIIGVVNISLIAIFYEIVKEKQGKKSARFFIITLSALLIFSVYKFGYFPVSNNLVKF